ncbi:hypothetical protein [Pseudomonas sp. BTN1]|uniref:hypothetical protein n=1 Tax=Pseudomonas sp. BTN1 TaxID=1750647 RepID=UPI0009397935|nr:hypothetical protein [Pseudomonas sp. BTN1]OKO47375.1 hypothetical protein BMH52_15725 [Pseudomonas sp. BTN1]
MNDYIENQKRFQDLLLQDAKFKKQMAQFELDQKMFAARLVSVMNAPLIQTAPLIRGSILA